MSHVGSRLGFGLRESGHGREAEGLGIVERT